MNRCLQPSAPFCSPGSKLFEKPVNASDDQEHEHNVVSKFKKTNKVDRLLYGRSGYAVEKMAMFEMMSRSSVGDGGTDVH